MKLTLDEEARIINDRETRHREYEEIYAYWLSIQYEIGATEKTCERFKCNPHKVMDAMSYCLKFTKGGIFKK